MRAPRRRDKLDHALGILCLGRRHWFRGRRDAQAAPPAHATRRIELTMAVATKYTVLVANGMLGKSNFVGTSLNAVIVELLNDGPWGSRGVTRGWYGW